jgi:hypothetical protein
MSGLDRCGYLNQSAYILRLPARAGSTAFADRLVYWFSSANAAGSRTIISRCDVPSNFRRLLR